MKAAPALWLLLSMAGAKDTDDRCDPTRERDDRACRAKLPNGEHSHGAGACCAYLGTGKCSDGFSYETNPAWACPLGPGVTGVTGCCYAPGSAKARYMDEYDGLCMLIIIYLVCSAMVGIVGCVCAKKSGHWAGRTLAEAPAAVPVSDIEATTIANPLLPEETPSAPPATQPSCSRGAVRWSAALRRQRQRRVMRARRRLWRSGAHARCRSRRLWMLLQLGAPLQTDRRVACKRR